MAGKSAAKRSARVPFRESAARVAPGAGRGISAVSPSSSAADRAATASCRAPLISAASSKPLIEQSSVGGQLPRFGRFEGYQLRGRWFRDDRYGPLRNAAWMLRNSRVGLVMNPAALRVVIHESEVLLREGERMDDVLEAFAELLIHP